MVKLMPRGSGYPIRLTLTKEMRVALTKLAAQEGSPKDFIVALKVFRAGLIGYGVLDEEGLQAMYLRKKIGDDEAQFLLENGFVKEDFRPVKSEPLLQANERRILNNQFKQVFERWENGSLKESTKMYYKREAEKHPDLPNARRLLELMKEARR